MDSATIAAIVLATLAAAAFGFTAHFQRIGLDRVDEHAASRINLTAIAACCWIAAPFTVDWSLIATPGALIFAAVGILFPFLTMQLQIASVPRVGATLTIAFGNFVPFFAVIPAIAFMGESLGLQGWIGLVVMSAAIIASTLRYGSSVRMFPLWALALPLGAAALRGFGMPAMKAAQDTTPDPVLGMLIMTTVSAVLIHALGASRRETPLPLSRGAAWLSCSGVAQFAGLLLMTYALAIGRVVVVTPIISTAPLFGLLYGALIFKREVLGWRHLLAGVLVVVGGALIVSR